MKIRRVVPNLRGRKMPESRAPNGAVINVLTHVAKR